MNKEKADKISWIESLKRKGVPAYALSQIEQFITRDIFVVLLRNPNMYKEIIDTTVKVKKKRRKKSKRKRDSFSRKASSDLGYSGNQGWL